MYPNTIAGSIPSGLPVFESLVKECMEEASIEPDIMCNMPVPLDLLGCIRTQNATF